MEDIIDAIFNPATQLLQHAYDALVGASLLASRGLDIGAYLGPLAWLGPQWLALIKSVFLSAALVVSVLVARSLFDLYLSLKSSVKWW